MADNRGFSDLLSTASSLLNSQSHSNPNPSPTAPSDSHSKPHLPPHSQKPSYGDVLSSAQVVMDAAKSKLHKSGDSASVELDKAKIAGAAGNLVGAVSHYGKLDQTSYGKYAHKAQEFLYGYEAKHGQQHGATHSSSPVHGGRREPAASPDVSYTYEPPPPGYPSHGSNSRP